MLTIDAVIDRNMERLAAPSALSIPAQTAFMVKKKEDVRIGLVYSIQSSRFSPLLQNEIIGSAANQRQTVINMDSNSESSIDTEAAFPADSLSPAPMNLAIAAEAPIPIPVPTPAIIA